MENWGSKRYRKTGGSRPGNLACFRVLSAAREAGVPVSGPGRPPSMPDAAHAGLHTLCHFATIVSFFEDFVYLFLERGEGREKERERNIGLQPRHVPQLGTEPMDLWSHTQEQMLPCSLSLDRGLVPTPHLGVEPSGVSAPSRSSSPTPASEAAHCTRGTLQGPADLRGEARGTPGESRRQSAHAGLRGCDPPEQAAGGHSAPCARCGVARARPRRVS